MPKVDNKIIRVTR